MRYMQLQNILHAKMNELERLCLRERELLDGKWKTHSLPARKKATTSHTDIESGQSPTDSDNALSRPAISTEDVPNVIRQQTGNAIIPPPAQYMLAYQYMDNSGYRYVLKPSTSNNSGEYVLGEEKIHRSPSDQQFVLKRSESNETASRSTKPPAPPPRTCEKHKPPAPPPSKQQHTKTEDTSAKSTQKSGKHCQGHSCNPCLGNFRWKSADKCNSANVASNINADNVSLDAYDLASPCCDTHCVPSRRKLRHHKEHHTHKHKHKHRDGEKDSSKERSSRTKSQSHASPGNNSHCAHQHVHQQYSDTHNANLRHYSGVRMPSHCSLHSCVSSEYPQGDSTSYTTSLSTDTLCWDQNSEGANSRTHSTKSRQSNHQHQQQQIPHHNQAQQQQQQQPHLHHHHHQQQGYYQQRYHITATQVQPSQIYPNTMTYVHKPKSWDDLAATGYGYGYLDTVATVNPALKLQINQQRHSMPRKNTYGRFSYMDVENYAPPPSQFVEELTTTTTTTITAKSTEELIAVPLSAIQQQPMMPGGCDCMSKQQQAALKAAQHQLSQNQKLSHQNACQLGYYSHLPRQTHEVSTSTSSANVNGADVATVSEITRL